jgi:hypothetical protein
MFEYTINGKRVVLKERLPLREYRGLPAIMVASKGEDYDSQVPVFCRLIDSWEFDGSPSDPASYEELDVISELAPLARAVVDYIERKASVDIKN